jgi:hypothetical protein
MKPRSERINPPWHASRLVHRMGRAIARRIGGPRQPRRPARLPIQPAFIDGFSSNTAAGAARHREPANDALPSSAHPTLGALDQSTGSPPVRRRFSGAHNSCYCLRLKDRFLTPCQGNTGRLRGDSRGGGRGAARRRAIRNRGVRGAYRRVSGPVPGGRVILSRPRLGRPGQPLRPFWRGPRPGVR